LVAILLECDGSPNEVGRPRLPTHTVDREPNPKARTDSIAVPAQGKEPRRGVPRASFLGSRPGEVRRGVEALRNPSLHQRPLLVRMDQRTRTDSSAVPAQGKEAGSRDRRAARGPGLPFQREGVETRPGRTRREAGWRDASPTARVRDLRPFPSLPSRATSEPREPCTREPTGQSCSGGRGCRFRGGWSR